MTLLELVKKHFNLVEAPVETTPSEFGEIKTADGELTLTYEGEEIAVGTPIFVKTDEGDIPAPDGKHYLAGGLEIVTVNGAVSEVGETAEELSKETETDSIATDEVELSEETASPIQEELAEHGEKDDMEDYPKREEIAETIAEILVPMMEEMKKDIEEMKSKFSAMDEKVEKFGAEPAAKRAKEEIYAKRNQKPTNNDFRNDEHKAVFERIMKRKPKK